MYTNPSNRCRKEGKFSQIISPPWSIHEKIWKWGWNLKLGKFSQIISTLSHFMKKIWKWGLNLKLQFYQFYLTIKKVSNFSQNSKTLHMPSTLYGWLLVLQVIELDDTGGHQGNHWPILKVPPLIMQHIYVFFCI